MAESMRAYFSVLLYLFGVIFLTVISFLPGQGLEQGSFLAAVLVILFIAFFLILKIKAAKLLLIILLVASLIGFIAYPAYLSNDVITYAIYGKILVFYHQLPWLVSPAHFPNDAWTSLTHWPTSTSRYGPVWIFLTALSYLGSGGRLIVSLYLLKAFGLIIFFINIYLIGKIAKSIGKNPLQLQKVFAFNPYIFIESVVSPHSDVLMTTFVLLAIYLYLSGKTVKFYLGMLLSIGVKVVSLPLALAPILKIKRLEYFVGLAYLGSAIIIAQWSINPWYLYLPITLSVLVWERKFFRYLAISLSIACLIRYLPYFYLGFFDPANKIRRNLFLLTMIPFTAWSLLKFLAIARREGYRK